MAATSVAKQTVDKKENKNSANATFPVTTSEEEDKFVKMWGGTKGAD